MPVNWEEHYQTGDTPWEKGAPHPALVDFLREQKPPLRGRILVPGCGAGHDVRALSCDGNIVLGIDIALGAITRAESFSQAGQETYELADLFDLPPRFRAAFDWVWEHTCFCAVDPAMRTRYVDAVADALNSGGHLFAVFFLEPDLGDGEEGPPFGVSTAEIDALFSRRFKSLREWTPGRTYEGREGREQMRIFQKRA